MSRISGGGQPPRAGDVPKPESELSSKEGVQKFREAAGKENVPKPVLDKFERAAPQIERQIQSLSAKQLMGQIKFTSEHLAQLAGAFASILKQHPRADRKERAKLFARAIIKNKRIQKLFEDADEQEIENMFEKIAEQLDGSPVFAQLVDDVTEGAKKINLG